MIPMFCEIEYQLIEYEMIREGKVVIRIAIDGCGVGNLEMTELQWDSFKRYFSADEELATRADGRRAISGSYLCPMPVNVEELRRAAADRKKRRRTNELS